MKPETPNWLLLVASLPARNAAARMRLWRGVKALGVALLRDGVYLLPDGDRALGAFERLAGEVTQAGGNAHLLRAACPDKAQAAAWRALFDRTGDYHALVKRIGAIKGAKKAAAAAHALRREFEAIAALDFFPGEAKAQAESALRGLDALAFPDEPSAARGRIRRLAKADFQGRTWATRNHLWVDRMASAWLIRRFIDRKARFLWLDKPKDCPKSALGFDFEGAAFTHLDGRVSFEVLMASFGLEDDPALARIGAIVHCLDVGGLPVEAAPGIEMVLAGLRNTCADDDVLLKEASRIFDSLYAANKGDRNEK